MAEYLIGLAERNLGGSAAWVIGVVATIVVLANTGIVQHLFRERGETARAARERLADDQQSLFRVIQAENAALREEIDEQRRRRAADRAEFGTELEALRRRYDEAIATIVSMERGRSRERHALYTVLTFLQIMRDAEVKAGRVPMQFNQWRELMEFGDPAIEAKIREMFGEDGQR